MRMLSQCKQFVSIGVVIALVLSAVLPVCAQDEMSAASDANAMMPADSDDVANAMLLSELVRHEAADKKALKYWREEMKRIDKQLNEGELSQTEIDLMYPRLMKDILRMQDKMIAAELKDDWHAIELPRNVLVELLEIRWQWWPLLSPNYREALSGYSVVAIAMMHQEWQFFERHQRVYWQWLAQWYRHTQQDFQVSPLPLLIMLVVILFYTLLLFAWFYLTSEHYQKKNMPFILSLPAGRVWLWISAMRHPLAWLVYSSAVLQVIYHRMDMIEFVLLRKVMGIYFLAYCLQALAMYALSQYKSLQNMNIECRDKIQLLLRECIMVLSIYYIVGVVMAVLLGGGTLLAWMQQFIVLYGCFYLILQLHVCNDMLQQYLYQCISRRHRWRAFIKDARLLKCVSSMAVIILMIEYGVKRYIHQNEKARKWMAYLSRKEMLRVSEKESRDKESLLPDAEVKPFLPAYEPPQFVDYGETALTFGIKHLQSKQRVFLALVGGRGMGKTTLIKRLQQRLGEQVKYVQCPVEMSNIYAVLAELLGMQRFESKEQLTALLKKYPKTVVCLDDCQRLITPAIGGLQEFECLLDLLRRCGGEISWVMSFESPAWCFFKRVRGERVLFDGIYELEPWSEQQIESLIDFRNKQIDLTPDFSNLFISDGGELYEQFEQDALDAESRESVRQQLLQQQAHARAYARVLWDYSGGNPRIALWAWRHSLYRGMDDTVQVGLFKNVDSTALDHLPELMLFVIKTIMLLEMGTLEAIMQSTNLNTVEVEDAMRYLTVRGFVERKEGCYTIAADWLRPVTVLLTRKHLLLE